MNYEFVGHNTSEWDVCLVTPVYNALNAIAGALYEPNPGCLLLGTFNDNLNYV